MGMVVGHELTHGFDDQGAQFDAAGNLASWWEPATEKQFKSRTSCVGRPVRALHRLRRVKLLATVDVHAPPQWRVNGTLSATPELARVFRCKAGAKLAPAKVCAVW